MATKIVGMLEKCNTMLYCCDIQESYRKFIIKSPEFLKNVEKIVF